MSEDTVTCSRDPTTGNLIRLDRIQNLWLWKKYTHCRERMLLKNPEAATEQELFHGARALPPDQLYRSEHGLTFVCHPPERDGVLGHTSPHVLGIQMHMPIEYSGFRTSCKIQTVKRHAYCGRGEPSRGFPS